MIKENGPELCSRVQGDERAIPNKGTSTGVDDSYNSDTRADAINRIRSMVRDRPQDPEAA